MVDLATEGYLDPDRQELDYTGALGRPSESKNPTWTDGVWGFGIIGQELGALTTLASWPYPLGMRLFRFANQVALGKTTRMPPAQRTLILRLTYSTSHSTKKMYARG